MVVCMILCCTICLPCCCCCCWKVKKSDIVQNYIDHIQPPLKKLSMIFSIAKQVLWIIARILFLLFRTIIWLVLLRYCRIMANHRAGAYKRTVHVQRILLRHKIDEMIQPAKASNFLTMHKCFEDPEYVLDNKNISLYCLSKREAVFVECDQSVDVTSSEVSSFLRIAQFKHAKNLIVMPMHVFLKLGEKVGHYEGNLIFITNTGRCGSTLLTQVFEETKQCVSLSEPDAFNTLHTLSSKLPSEDFDSLIEATMNLSCRSTNTNITSYVIKLAQTNTPLVPYLSKLFPEAHHIFMYRDGITVAKSVAKVVRGTPLTGFLMRLAKNYTCMKLAKGMARKAGLPIDDFDEFDTVHGPLQVGTIMWASAIRQYLDFRNSGIEMAAVRYEDMVSDTDYALEKIFKWCNIPYNKDAVAKAFSRDSQRGSPISKEKLGKFDHEEITETVRQKTDYACQMFKVPSIYTVYIADNTITYRAITENLVDSSEIYSEVDEVAESNLNDQNHAVEVHVEVEVANEIKRNSTQGNVVIA